jgi:hypothetical protein
MSVPSHDKLPSTSKSFKLIVNKGIHQISTYGNINTHSKSNITSLSADLSNISISQSYYPSMIPSTGGDCSITLTNTQSSESSNIIKVRPPDLQTLLRLKAKSVNADAVNKEHDKARSVRYKAADILIRKQQDELLKQQVQDWDSLYSQNEVLFNETTKDSTFDDRNRNTIVTELPRGVPKLPMQQIGKLSSKQHYAADPQVNTVTRGQALISEDSLSSPTSFVEDITNLGLNIAALSGSESIELHPDNKLILSSPSQPDRMKPKSKQITRQAQLQGFELWVTTQCQLTDPLSRDNSLQSTILFRHYTKWCQQPAQKDIITITAGSDFGRLMNKRLPGCRYEKSKATYYSGISLK